MKRKWITTILAGAVIFMGSWGLIGQAKAYVREPDVRVQSMIQSRYSNINNIRSTLVLDGATADASAFLTCRTSSNITITMKLQKKVNGSWSTVKTWTGSYQGIYGNLEKTYTLTSRGTYRVSSSFKADSETATLTSFESTY